MDLMQSTPVSEENGNIALAAAGRQQKRKIFYLVDSMDVGGTETQAVELALRMAARGHEVTLGCLRMNGPLLEKLKGSPVRVKEFHPKGGPRHAHGTLPVRKTGMVSSQRKIRGCAHPRLVVEPHRDSRRATGRNPCNPLQPS